MKDGKVIGIGNTATVYEWEEGKVLKLFSQGYPKEEIEREFRNAKVTEHMDFAKPKVYEIISCGNRFGIVYEKVNGESMLDWVMKTQDVQKCAANMANLHKSILLNSINNVPNYKKFLEYNIENTPSINSKDREEALQILDQLPDGDTLCHGDFHPGNILISHGYTMVIDFMNICHGDFLYDIARTVFLVEYTPVPIDVEDREIILRLKKTLTDLYLMEMNVTREMIQDYLTVITVARVGECPNEKLS